MNQLADNRSGQPAPRTWSAVRRAVPAVALLVAVLLSAPPARATGSYGSTSANVTLYSGLSAGLPVCMGAIASLADIFPYFYPVTEEVTMAGCSEPGRVMPTGWMAIYQVLYYWNGASWVGCQSQGWNYNTAPSATLYTPNLKWSSGQCGQGYYGLQSSVWVWDGAEWQGGAVWSGALYFGVLN